MKDSTFAQIHAWLDVACHLCQLIAMVALARLAWQIAPGLVGMWRQWMESGVAK